MHGSACFGSLRPLAHLVAESENREMTRDEIDAAASALADVLVSIEAGSLDASAEQRAYLAGALDALRALDHDPPL